MLVLRVRARRCSSNDRLGWMERKVESRRKVARKLKNCKVIETLKCRSIRWMESGEAVKMVLGLNHKIFIRRKEKKGSGCDRGKCIVSAPAKQEQRARSSKQLFEMALLPRCNRHRLWLKCDVSRSQGCWCASNESSVGKKLQQRDRKTVKEKADGSWFGSHSIGRQAFITVDKVKSVQFCARGKVF